MKNKKVVLTRIGTDGWALLHASSKLQEEKQVELEALEMEM